MKKIAFAVLVRLMSTGVGKVYAETVDCGEIAKGAEMIMEARQIGVSLSDLLAAVEDVKVFRMMVIESFETSRYTTESVKSRVVSEFANKWHLACIKSKE